MKVEHSSGSPRVESDGQRPLPRHLPALRRLELLDTAPEEAFDRLTRLASKLLRAPVALVSLLDQDRQFFKSQCGLSEPWATRRETPLSHSFCQHVVESAEPLIVADAREHPLLRDNLAIRDLGVVAYAGIPLTTSAGETVGSFCTIDSRPREWTAEEIETITELAGSVMTEIELRAAVRIAEHAHAELRRRDERLELALRAGRLGAWELDIATGTLECSAQCKANFGLPADARFTYGDLFEAIHPEDQDHVRERIGEAIQSGTDYEVKYRAVWPDASVHWIEAHGIVSCGDHGEPLRMSCITQDVTGQTLAKQELEELSRSKSEFMAVMSHELRTPLTGIMAYSELLLMGAPTAIPASAQEQVRRIDNAARHLLVLIEEILTFSRVEAKQEVIRFAREDVGEIVEEAALFIRPMADKKELPVAVELPGPIEIHTDGGKVRQILLNLLSNAVKFTSRGGIRITASGDASRVLVHVQDTGPGIARRHLAKIFEPFWQVDQSARRSVGGTGLGLSVSRQMARSLGGDLQVESVVGGGSVFTLSLPRNPEAGSRTHSRRVRAPRRVQAARSASTHRDR